MKDNVALVIAVIAQALVLLTVVWKASSTITKLEVTLDGERKARERLELILEQVQIALAGLNTIPLHAQKIQQLEDDFAAQRGRIADLWRKVFSLDKHVAVARALSEHDIEVENDTDPPGPGGEDYP